MGSRAENLDSSIHGIAVGWLGNEAPSSGEIPAELCNALRHACQTRETDAGEPDLSLRVFEPPGAPGAGTPPLVG